LSETGNQPGAGGPNGQPATPAAAAAPTSGVWGKWSGAYTPGIQAAIASGGSGQPGMPNKNSGINKALLFGGDPIGSSLGGIGLSGFLGNALGLEPNNSQLQDIGGALFQGGPVTDANWANAGYGPGGAALTAQPPATLGGSTLGGMQGIVNTIAGKYPGSVTPAAGGLATSAAIKYANPGLFGGSAAP
jgi:hypothetical protein